MLSRWYLPFLFLTILPACYKPDPDADRDGVPVSRDCDDNDFSVHPGAKEICGDGVDQDCSGGDSACEEAPPDWDGDGFDALDAGGEDCNDQRSDIYPGAEEIAYDGIDQDCNGADIKDVDGDGQDASMVGGPDCDDSDAYIYDGAAEVPYDGVDQDCDNADLRDVDQDGHDAEVVGGDDCDDEDRRVYPGAEDTPGDGIDENCDGLDYPDSDGDGYNASVDCDDEAASVHPGAEPVFCDEVDENCDGALEDVDCDGADALPRGDDCDDLNPEIFAGAVEVSCNDVDENCDGMLSDQDCDGENSQALGGNDCDDLNSSVHSMAPEAPGNQVDDNCDGAVDERVTMEGASAAIVGREGSRAGTAVALGDLDKDGRLDIVVGAPEWVDAGGVRAGAVFVIPGTENGPSDSLLREASVVYGQSEGDHFGETVAIGDTNDDGTDDLIVGAPAGYNDNGLRTGRVYVVPGGSLAPASWVWESALFSIQGLADGGMFGAAVAFAEDVNNDGIGDMLVGAPGEGAGGKAESGRAYLFFGREVPSARSTSDADFIWTGSDSGSRTGAFVAGLGDVDFDGVSDIAVSSPGTNMGAGKILLALGQAASGGWTPRAQIVMVVGGEEGQVAPGLGPVIRAGDLNGDGVSDLLLGAPNMGNGKGTVYALFGQKLTGTRTQLELVSDAGASFVGESDGDHFGAVLVSGRVDGDVCSDMFVGASGRDEGRGAVYLLMGQVGQDWVWGRSAGAARSIWEGAYAGQGVGTALAIGDLNGDQWQDLVVGAPGDDTDGENAGAAFVFPFRWVEP